MKTLFAVEDAQDAAASENRKSGLLQLVTFGLGNEQYAVDILKVQEINRMKEITKVPNAPSYVEGVINLRGKVMTVVDLRKRFGLSTKENNAHSRIMIMDIQGITVGLVVDAVSEVLRIQANIVEPTPPLATEGGSEFIIGIAKLENRLIILLDIDRLIGTSEDALMSSVSKHSN
jgi:purine-binding chemotaxis protein CheW